MNINQLTAHKIKELRLKLNLHADAVASELQIDKSNYSKLENRRVEITIAKLEAVAKVLKVPIAALLPISPSSNVNINNGDYSCNGTLINNYNNDPKLIESLQSAVDILHGSLDKIK